MWLLEAESQLPATCLALQLKGAWLGVRVFATHLFTKVRSLHDPKQGESDCQTLQCSSQAVSATNLSGFAFLVPTHPGFCVGCWPH